MAVAIFYQKRWTHDLQHAHWSKTKCMLFSGTWDRHTFSDIDSDHVGKNLYPASTGGKPHGNIRIQPHWFFFHFVMCVCGLLQHVATIINWSKVFWLFCYYSALSVCFYPATTALGLLSRESGHTIFNMCHNLGVHRAKEEKKTLRGYMAETLE